MGGSGGRGGGVSALEKLRPSLEVCRVEVEVGRFGGVCGGRSWGR